MSRMCNWLLSAWNPYTESQAQNILERKIMNDQVGICVSLRNFDHTSVMDEMELVLNTIANKSCFVGNILKGKKDLLLEGSNVDCLNIEKSKDLETTVKATTFEKEDKNTEDGVYLEMTYQNKLMKDSVVLMNENASANKFENQFDMRVCPIKNESSSVELMNIEGQHQLEVLQNHRSSEELSKTDVYFTKLCQVLHQPVFYECETCQKHLHTDVQISEEYGEHDQYIDALPKISENRSSRPEEKIEISPRNKGNRQICKTNTDRENTCNSARPDCQGHDSITALRIDQRSQSHHEPRTKSELEPRSKSALILDYGNQAKRYLQEKFNKVSLSKIKSSTKSVTWKLQAEHDSNIDESDLPSQGTSGLNQENSPSDDDIKEEDLVYGEEGYKQYKLFTNIERGIQIEEIFNERERIRSLYRHRISSIREIIEVARAYYINPDDRAVEDWRKLKGSLGVDDEDKSQTYIRTKLAKLPDFMPMFTSFIILAQLVTCGVLIILGGLTDIGIEPKVVHKGDIQTFLGIETVHKWTAPNVWIGPSNAFIISVGAFFSPCMRDDIEIHLLSLGKNYSTTDELGCCELDKRNTAATTTELECLELTLGVGTWKSGVRCSERISGENSVFHNLKPCCYNFRSECMLTTHEHCVFLGGFYSKHGPEHCSEVNCLSDICSMGGLDPNSDQPWLANKPRQWWRIPLSIIYHHGVIHVVVVCIMEFLIMRVMEKSVGWLRIMLVYVLSGIGGILAAAIFEPYIAHVGGIGSVCGLLGVTVVEILLLWRFINRPFMELLKVLFVILLFLLSGTLPFISIYTVLSGLLIGVCSALVVLPCVSFSKISRHTRNVLMVMCILILFGMYFILIFVFFKIQIVENCYYCILMNCVPYTDDICSKDYGSLS